MSTTTTPTYHELMENQAQIARRWAIGFWIPNVPLQTRIRSSAALDDLAVEQPDWFHAFASGVLSDLAVTLPSDDKWRLASARIGDLAVGSDPPDADGSTLGTLDDFEDLAVEQPRPEWMNDVISAPSLGDSPPPEAFVLVAVAMVAPDQLRDVVQLIADRSTSALREAFDGAARWLVHRRVMHGVCTSDLFPVWSSTLSAIRAAWEIEYGEPYRLEDGLEADLDADRLARNSVEAILSGRYEDEEYL